MSMKEKFHLTDQQVFAIKTLVKVVLIWGVVILCGLLAFSSCKSIKTDVKYEYRDSIITHYVMDTIRVTITDTIHVEQSSESTKEDMTEIEFGAGGGTYNAQTGEATNVQSVKQSSKEKELQSLVASYKHVADSQSIKIDSLQQVISEAQGEEHLQQNTKEITPRSGWDKFCTWYVIISWILIVMAVAWWFVKKFYLRK